MPPIILEDVVTLTIDGQEVRAREGSTILEAAQGRPGIGEIPTLCHHPAVVPYGACRLCTVEVTEGNRTRLVTSCLFPARDGIVVQTSTERVNRLRQGLMELLLARCPNVPVVQEMARKMGVGKPRFTLGDEQCILCGLCTRACAEIIGKSAISLVSRGVEREVAGAFFDVSNACIGCGDCVYICPTKCITLGRNGKAVLARRKGTGYGAGEDVPPDGARRI